MLITGLLAGVEHGLNRVLQMDSTALPRLARLEGKVIEVDCQSPALKLFILPGADGLQLAGQWGEADCVLSAPAGSLLRLALAKDKTAVLHRPEVALSGDSAVLLELAGILQDLELDWEYELSRWLGPGGSQLAARPTTRRTRPPTRPPPTCPAVRAGSATAWTACARPWPTTWPRSRAAWSANARPRPASTNWTTSSWPSTASTRASTASPAT